MQNIDRYDYKSRVKHLSLFPAPEHMGPLPPGFVEPILSGMQWIRGIEVSTTLRLHIAKNDLSQQNIRNDVYMVSFISSQN